MPECFIGDTLFLLLYLKELKESSIGCSHKRKNIVLNAPHGDLQIYPGFCLSMLSDAFIKQTHFRKIAYMFLLQTTRVNMLLDHKQIFFTMPQHFLVNLFYIGATTV